MNIRELLSECIRNGIRLAESNGDLRVYFDGAAPDRELLALLREHKQEILRHLRQPDLRQPNPDQSDPGQSDPDQSDPSQSDPNRSSIKEGERIPVLSADARTAFPASTAQRRMWLLDKLDGAGAAYNMVGIYRLRGAFRTEFMQAALDAVVARHEALRTVFAEMDGDVRQCILPAARVPFEHVDLSKITTDQKERALLDLLARENDWHFDLTAAPLLRATCAYLGDDAWALVLNVHHIASDGWSIGILERDISAFYTAFSSGDAVTPPATPIQYVDYVAWSGGHAQGASGQSQLAYWKSNLEGLPALHGLPLDKPRPPVQVYTGATIRRTMPMSWLHTAQTFCQARGATLFMHLHAALATVLGIYANEKDIVVGFPVSGRQREELETVVGLFVNTLVLRVFLKDDMSFSDVLSASRTAVIDALKHRDVPFDTLIDVLRTERSPAHNPLTQIFLTLQTHEQSGLRMPGLDVELQDNPDAPIKFDLQMDAFPSRDGLVIDWRFNRSLFDDTSMARMADSLVRLLEASVREPDRPISHIDLLASDERALLLETWNQTDAPYPADRCIHQLFERQVQRDPDAVALVFQDQSLSYAELNAQANRIAHALIEHGVRPDDRVAICLDRSLAMVVGLLAILKAGGAYVPLDPSYPADRLAQILADADPKMLLCDRAGRSALGEAALRARIVLDLDQSQPPWRDHSERNPDPIGLTSRHLAYVIYTSGSTGAPKGVMNEHHAVVNRLTWMPEAYRLGPGDVVIQKTPFGFDVSVWEFFWTLLHGATLAIAPPDAHKDPGALIELIVRHRVTIAHFVPSMLTVFLHARGIERCVTLRRLICSGEALAGATLRRALQLLPQASLHNLYGPTEAAIEVTAWTCPRDFAGETVPIGRPIANTRIYLLDAHDRPVPLGAIGELHIGGVGVARGYLNRPQLTEERFIPNPFVADPHARLYRTGDHARYLADGDIEFLGRNDHQVKLRGFRIELGEIEARIAGHPAVHSAVVLVVGDGDRKRLVAYVVPLDGHAGDLAADLRADLMRALPDYMVPAAFVRLDALPLTANGKLDRKALPAPDDDAFARRGYAPPQEGIETSLADAWRELLGEERVGRHDHFFELGGDSLLAVRLISRIDSIFGVRLPLAEFFARSTLSELAESIAQRQAVSTASPAAIMPAARGEALPLSFSQQRLWFLAQLDHAAGAAYHMPAALRLEGELDVAALRATLDRIVARHENLRTRFVEVAEGPVQQFAPADVGFALTQTD
ncbi:MAG: amino acid adenylation domain-containing protein, partial [Lysobacteraceae bacterium]